MPEPKIPGDAAGSAMQRAVVAEHDARQAIAAAQVSAAAELEAARAQARAIANAVPDRIARLRARGTRAVQRALAQLEADEAAALQALGQSAFPPGLVEPTTAALVARLSGGEPEPPP